MEIRISRQGAEKIICLEGDVNKFESDALMKEFDGLDSCSRVVVDLSQVTFLDSGFVNLMIQIKNGNPAGARKIVLAEPPDFILEILRVTQLDKLYEVSISEGQLAQNQKKGGTSQ